MRILLLATLLLSWLGQAVAQEPVELGTICGRLQVAGVEQYSGVVSLWNADQIPMPDPRRYILIPSQAGPIEGDGSFLLRAPPGRYYLGAVLRQTPGPQLGPPRAGDQVFMTPDADGEALVVELTAAGRVDVGRQGGGWVYQGFSEEAVTGISGQVVAADGQPLKDMLVFAFLDPEMSGQPLAVSSRTGADGNYLLRLPGGGEVYLRVRDNYGGGAPSAGGVMGVYGNAVPRPVAVEGGKVLTRIDISTLTIPALRTGEKQPTGGGKGGDGPPMPPGPSGKNP